MTLARPAARSTYPALYTLHNYLYCMMASTVLMQRPVLGGAMFLSAHVADLSLAYLGGEQARALAPVPRLWLTLLSALCAAVSLGLLLIYPRRVGLPSVWLLFALVMLTFSRSQLLQRVARSYALGRRSKAASVLLHTETVLFFSAAAAVVLFSALDTQDALYLLGGYAITAVMEAALPRGAQPPVAPREAASETEAERALGGISVYRLFRRILLLSSSALQVTMILIYTFIGTTADSLFVAMAIAFFCTALAGSVARRAFLRRPESDPSNVLLFGLVLWLMSLAAFFLRSGVHLFRYLSLALCSAGTAIALTAFEKLDAAMRDVAAFALGVENDSAHTERSRRYAELFGQMVALIGLALSVFLGERGGLPASPPVLQPLLLLPALILVAAATVFALRFPLNKAYMDKLTSFLRQQRDGLVNAPLQKQLEEVILRAAKRRYGIRILMFFVRLFTYHRVVGRENVRAAGDVSHVFVCNHGEIYGPIIANVYLPYPVRPWAISEVTDPRRTADYIYEGTYKRQKWLPEKWRYPAARLVAPIIIWATQSIGSIPVYRNNLRELMTTFRLTAEAMEAGDHILVFPENPMDERMHTGSYVRGGVGEFYTGFTMVAPLYYKRTGKKCVFVPLYADQKNRTLTLGKPVAYDPDNEPNAEKRRLCDALRGEMLRMAGEGDAT